MGALNIIEYFVGKFMTQLLGNQFLMGLAVIVLFATIFFGMELNRALALPVGVLIGLFLVSFGFVPIWMKVIIGGLLSIVLTFGLKNLLSGGGYKE